MLLVGYGVIKEGDKINELVNNYSIPMPIIQTGDPRIGKTFWIFKDSYYNDYAEIEHNLSDGYAYVLFEDCSQMGDINSIKTPIIIPGYNSNNILCKDSDGDGYYFWGIGPKPATCPSWVPDESDGDDSNIAIGPMDNYGNLESLPAGITIKNSVTYSSSGITTQIIGIVNGATLTIQGDMTQTGNSKIRVCEGGTLIVDGCSLYNANIEMIPGSRLIIRNNGTINVSNEKEFSVPKGVFVDIECGSII